MRYNEYKAPAGKVLFNLDDFTWGNTMLSVHDLNIIILDRDEAERISKEYNDAKEAIREAEINNQSESNQEDDINVQADAVNLELNENGEYEEVPDDTEQDKLLKHRKDVIAELLAKGISFNQANINCSIKETKHI